MHKNKDKLNETPTLVPARRTDLPVEEIQWPRTKEVRPQNFRLRNFRFTDEEKINSYSAQLGCLSTQRETSTKVGMKGFKPEGAFESKSTQSHYRIEKRTNDLIDALRDADMLCGYRPKSVPHFVQEEAPLIHEFCEARQFIFPKTAFSTPLGIESLKIWVSPPSHGDFIDEPFKWTGSYLILTEIHFDDGHHRGLISGCSALKMVFNRLNNLEAYETGAHEILGRWDERTMVQKIMSFGGIPLDSVQIETLYQIRYMTNEQYDPAAPQEGRVHDILGYPLFIAS